MHSIYATSAALLACLTGIAQADSVYKGSACAIAPVIPTPSNTICNKPGAPDPARAKLYEIVTEQSGRLSLCAQYW